jgi:hypothetical protein
VVQAWVPSREWGTMKARLEWSIRDNLVKSGLSLPPVTS